MSSYIMINDADHWAHRFGKTRTNKFKDPGFYDKWTGDRMEFGHNAFDSTPMVMSDMPAHIGPSGNYVSGRAAFREECRRTGCVPRESGLKGAPKGFLNPKIAKNFGKEVNPAHVEAFKHERKQAYARAGLTEKDTNK